MTREWLLAGALASAIACVACDTPPMPDTGATPAPSPYLAVAKGQVDVEGGVYRLAGSRDGIITGVFVEEGAVVRAGQVLARIDDRQPRLALAQADAEVRQARAELPILEARLHGAERERERFAPLAADDTTARRDADQAADDVRILQAQIVHAQMSSEAAKKRAAVAAYEVEQRTVRAPLEGRIVRRHARLGDGVSTLNVTPLFLFVPNVARIVRAEVDERFVDRLAVGQEAEIVLEADETRRFRGRLSRVGEVFGDKQPTIDPAERMDVRVVECVVSIDDQSLRIGQRVLVHILKPGATSAPKNATPGTAP